jgi:hypothetical protein
MADLESVLERSSRYRDYYRSVLVRRGGREEDIEREMDRIDHEYAHERRLVVAMEALTIARRFSFSDFYGMLLQHLIWLDEWVYLFTHTRASHDIDFDTYRFKAGDEEIILAVHSSRRQDADLWVNRMCHLLGTSIESTVSIEAPVSLEEIPTRSFSTISAVALSLLVETHQNLKAVKLKKLLLIEETCQFIDAASTIGVDFELSYCNVRNAAAAAILLQSVRKNRGPTKMLIGAGRGIDPALLLEALHDNTRLKVLRFHILEPQDSFASNIQGLSVNKGITELNVFGRFDNRQWTLLCRSLESNQTVEILSLGSSVPATDDNSKPEMKRFRTQAVLDMMNINTTIHRIDMHHPDRDEQLYGEWILPLMCCNMFRPRLRAIQQAPVNLQMDLVGKEFVHFENDRDFAFMLLTQFPEFVALALRDLGDDECKSEALMYK